MPRTRRMLCRAGRLRGINEKQRTATYVAATERPVDMGWVGVEVLRMRGLTVSRYEKNPVFLDAHNYDSVGCVIGSASVRVEGTELIAEVTYATTERAEEIWRLVREGHVRAVSAGYAFEREDVKKVKSGERDGDVTGPASVVERWELLELSQISVPADEDAVRRSFYQQEEEGMNYPQPDPAAEPETPAAEPEKPAAAASEGRARSDAEERAVRAEVVRREVMARCPERLRSYAEELLLLGGTADEICEHLRAEVVRTHRPVGSSEPQEPEAAPAVWDDDARAGLRAAFGGR